MRRHLVIGFLSLLVLTVNTFSSESRAQDAEEITEILVRMQSDVPQVRAAAALELGERGINTQATEQALGLLLVDPNARVRRAAMIALRQLQPDPQLALPPLTRMLADEDPAVAAQAAQLLATFDKAAVPYMIRALEVPEARYWAVLVLADLGPSAQQAVPALIELMDTDQPELRREVIMALGAIGPEAKAAVPALLQVLNGDDPALAASATYALGRMGQAAQLASAALRDQLQAEDPFLRIVTAWALANLNPQDQSLQQQSVSMLVKALTAEDPQVRVAAARAIVDLRPNHEVLLPLLGDVVEHGSEEGVREAVQAFALVGPPAVPGLRRMLQYEQVRPLAARALGRLGPQAAEAVPALVQVLPQSEPATQREVLYALGSIGAPAAPAVPQMMRLLQSDDSQVRYAAVFALGRIGPPAGAAVPALREGLKDKDDFFRMTSAWSLARIMPGNAQVAELTVPLLLAALEHDRVFVRVEAADALGRLGPAARPAAERLRRVATEDENELVQRTAGAALAKIIR